MTSKLEAFLKSRGIKPAHLARESGYSRQHLLRIRMGRMEPTRRCIAAIVAACRKLSHEPVRAADLFDLESDEL
jgi:predicted transcriptional regulator